MIGLDLGLGELFGGMAEGWLNKQATEKATEKQIEWERERATHAHQWEVEDLIKAGLNPILSAGGSGAVTGGISAPVPDWSGIRSAFANTSARKQAETAKKAQEATEKVQDKNIEQMAENIKNLKEQIENTKLQNEILRKDLKAKESNTALQIKNNNIEQEYLRSPVGRTIRYVSHGVKDMGGAVVGGAIGGAMGQAARTRRTAAQINSAQKAPIVIKENTPYLIFGKDGKAHWVN